MPTKCCLNPYARIHAARIRATWKLLHKKVGEGELSLLLLDHDEAGDGGLSQVAAIAPGGFFVRAKEDPLTGNFTEIHIALDAVAEGTLLRVSAFQFGRRQYARKDRHPDIEEPAGVNQFYAFLAEPKEVL